MKLKNLLQYDFIKDFEKLLVTDFEKKLFLASLRNYCSHGNPLRFHNFSFSMRELVLQMIDRRAPDSKVKSAIWYSRESDRFEVTRRQKLKYCAQGILSDAYLDTMLLNDLNQSIKDYLKEFNFFNKYTHITEKYLNACPKQFYADIKFIIQRSREVLEEIDSLENLVIDSIPETLQDILFNHVISNFPSELDILAHNVIVESVSPEELGVTYLEENGITVAVSGTVYVTQEYGKGDDFTELHENYPFSISIELNVDDPTDITIDQSDFEIDTSSWFDV
ncbi:hypothetical protein OGW18_04075 [Citrobacter sp. CK184]|uniref:pPIWI-associating nuclease domain-containing protein n=1 Tax=Citrobacter TaxID=544 RepID=UPI0019066919|nr:MULTISPECIES: hypothetical protein [Citrobacter]EKV5611833.1 hypothetical protein [Citrobacter koseri]MBJ9246082.1 hypothetical protein [Citrobacter koseri]MDM3029907.1 hypothetical protein [Citrobacter sp. CK185]MDM3045496.1 hypothetical protein [Citrobacter sp. CK184]WEE18388.1 hypothetical protein PX343_05530 [Citrobacter koseri]